MFILYVCVCFTIEYKQKSLSKRDTHDPKSHLDGTPEICTKFHFIISVILLYYHQFVLQNAVYLYHHRVGLYDTNKTLSTYNNEMVLQRCGRRGQLQEC